ncbi:MAG: hypothetical protein NZ924_06640 [Candidatus Bipolaricaulota bacterium]|nr:hypothetical protein [Candidatus Bipolaricaulota bacterium]MDW8152557.1 hypothetical protein [Candidatus Bipolaricaulota bacterium]
MEVWVREDGTVVLGWAGRAQLVGFGVQLRLREGALGRPDLSGPAWAERQGVDALGPFRSWHRALRLGPVPLEERLFLYEGIARHEVHFPHGVSGLRGSRDFREPAVRVSLFALAPQASYFLCTFGLDGEGGDYPGGYWPEARWGRADAGLPGQPFAPLVVYDGAGALAVAPGELFLLSPLVAEGGRVGRALAGDFPALPAGTALTTWFAFGRDPGEALRRLGEVLLRLGGKARPDPQETPLLSRLGYWNAYGSYYTELIHPMEERILRALAAEFRAKGLPVGYIGLDLWYPYARIGQALEFRPDPRKYPRGLAALREETGLPYVLHLSALSAQNAYGADGADPAVYEAIAAELKGQGAVGVWHDWLRTWQFLTPALLSDPWRAEAWFSGMCRAFRAAGLPLLLCMQTMGMVLASTREANVVAARSFTDHLFSLRLALGRAAKADPGIERAWQKPVHIWQQNLLVGYVQWALGLAPFHDLFLSRRHPGFGGEHALEDAVLRALSCGPVGFGDACGLADAQLLARLVLPDGRLAQPARPPEPLWPTLDTPTPAFLAETQAGELRWVYALVLNLGEEEARVRLPLAQEGFLAWDPLGRRVAAGEVTVPPGGLAYRALLPKLGEAALLGFPELLVPWPAQALVRIEKTEGKLNLELPKGLALHAVFANGKMVPVEELGTVRIVRRE